MPGRLLVLLAVTAMAALGCAGSEARPTSASIAVAAPQAAPAEVLASTPTSTPMSTPPIPTATVPTVVTSGEVRVAPKDQPRVFALPRPVGDRTRLVVIDPGHAQDEVGAAANGVVEKHSNLDFALRVEALLQQQGVRAVLTRRADERAYADGTVIQGNSTTRRDLQARVDLANDLSADAFVSIHSNGAASTSERGVETYWDSGRPFADSNLRLATAIQSAVVGEMAVAGTPVVDRGTKDDACLRMFRGRCFPLFVLGPPRNTTGAEIIQRDATPGELGMAPGQTAVSTRATSMPGVLVELLFISSPADAALLRDEAARDAMARGIARGILEYLNGTAPRTG